ncbi:MAG: glutamine--fructose-6-phosphate transaminase (isomerizing) [Deltaproteobacteria bacterium]|nr:glutamine--fructose-6-phosphate transaminase (isomerizing) [Deltaproteobacteria bacterium]
MCGIVGYIGKSNATPILMEGLSRLEYRGYDSAGIAVREKKAIRIVRSVGKLIELDKKLKSNAPVGTLGIGHTRWATHGRPNETNAHPHKAGPVVLVHNGIFENYGELHRYLAKKGHTLKTETDTELACHLIQQRLYDGLSMEKAFFKALSEIEGSYALAVLHEEEPDRIYFARRGSPPLVVGLGEGENFVASDIPAILSHTRRVVFLEDGDAGILWRDRCEIWNLSHKKVRRPIKTVNWSLSTAEKGGFKHFMLKEIFEQPRVVGDTLSGQLSEKQRRIYLRGVDPLFSGNGSFPFDKIYLVACGTSYHAALAGKYYMEEMARLPVMVDQASEFRYRNPILDRKTLIVAISQSGETADTLAAVQIAKEKGAKVISICNVVDSAIPRGSDTTLYTRAGPEIGVASTKAFTTQMVMLLLMALRLGRIRQTFSFGDETFDALVKLPKQIQRLVEIDLRDLAEKYAHSPNFLYFGRGIHYPIALEGALKLKEISYIHAEGYSAGEMKHGPIALIDRGMPVVVLAPQDKTYEKVMGNIEEVRARGASVIAIATQGDKQIAKKCQDVIYVPKAPWYITPILMTIPLQLLAYHIADHKGTDIDQPRNLAKSVTVE